MKRCHPCFMPHTPRGYDPVYASFSSEHRPRNTHTHHAGTQFSVVGYLLPLARSLAGRGAGTCFRGPLSTVRTGALTPLWEAA